MLLDLLHECLAALPFGIFMLAYYDAARKRNGLHDNHVSISVDDRQERLINSQKNNIPD